MRKSPILAVLAVASLAWLSACGAGGDDGGQDPTDPTPISPGTWTWMSGTNLPSQPGVYGTKGVPDASNVPGSRHSAVAWTDRSGNLWLFGGQGKDAAGVPGYNDGGCLNDLWKFDPATGLWTWVSGGDLKGQPGLYGTRGVADPSNVPGARDGAVAWLGPEGDFWLFGGYGGGGGTGEYRYLNDLWKYDPGTNEWTWISGSSSPNQEGTFGTKGVADPLNVPGARYGAVSWADPGGDLWLFGGAGYDCPNDLWKFDPGTLEWTWVSGSNAYSLPSYGTKGVASPSNVPGVRREAVSWVDPNGKLWLFGGDEYDDPLETWCRINDLWKFDPVTAEWTWVSGNDRPSQVGWYRTRGIAHPACVPGARQEAVSWIDRAGKLWLFGGVMGSYSNLFNDVWQFDPGTGNWTWVTGSKLTDQPANFGTKGVPASMNDPGACGAAVSWTDSSGAAWLFHGQALWRYTR